MLFRASALRELFDSRTVTVMSAAAGVDPTREFDDGGALRTVSTASTMTWSPSGAATDLSGAACSTAPVSETGAADREF